MKHDDRQAMEQEEKRWHFPFPPTLSYWHALKRLKTTLHACFTNIKLIVCFAGQQLHQENVQLSHWFLNCLGQEKPTEKSFANHKIHITLL